MTCFPSNNENVGLMMSVCDFLPDENSLDSENDGKEQYMERQGSGFKKITEAYGRLCHIHAGQGASLLPVC